MKETLKILIVRFSSIGDIILTTPIIRILKKQLNAEVHYLTKSVYKSVLKNNPYLDKIYHINNSLSEVVSDLKQEQYDYLVDLHNNLRTRSLKFQLRIPSKSFKKLNVEKFLFTKFKINILPEIHLVDRYLETLKSFNIKDDEAGLDFFFSKEDKINTKEYEEIMQKKYIGFVIGGKHKTKVLPTHKIISIINKLNENIILVGGPEDYQKADKIIKKTKNTFNFCGKFTIHQSAYILKNAKYIITHDTGMMHIASALNKTIYSVWGNTVPEFGMYPYKPNNASKIIQVDDLNCRPCSKIGYNSCPKTHFKCMEDIDENLFFNK